MKQSRTMEKTVCETHLVYGACMLESAQLLCQKLKIVKDWETIWMEIEFNLHKHEFYSYLLLEN